MDRSKFTKLASSSTDIKDFYDVIVIGSGYGGSIAASRCARAGQKVCLLEKGKEWLPGEFAEDFLGASKHVQATYEGKCGMIGDPSDLYEINIGKSITVVTGCGLGGGSLINANVAIDADDRVFDLPAWPEEFKQDLDNLHKVDKKQFTDMLRPTTYPATYPTLPKTVAMTEAAQRLVDNNLADVEDLNQLFVKLPQFINFDDSKPNPVGIKQPACNGCGNCMGGCNTGAKNTLNLNYIPDAVAHGAEVFTEVEVNAVLRDSFTSLWRTHFRRKLKNGKFEGKESIIRSKYVIMGAGALGSTKILLKSKARGLELSEALGSRFTGNGDTFGFCYKGDRDFNAVGADTGFYDEVTESSPGPTLVNGIDLRKVKGETVEEGMLIVDLTIPSIIRIPYAVITSMASHAIGTRSKLDTKSFLKFHKKFKGSPLQRTIALAGVAHDGSEGKIYLHEKTGHVHVKWDAAGQMKIFEKVNKKLESVANGFGGTYVKNPIWTETFGKDIATFHPMGGCPMGSHGKVAVVNHKGQVYVGDSSEVYPDLYVMDGSIIPVALGANPALTIGAVAERCCRLMAEDAGWKIDYTLNKHLDDQAFVKKKPGLRFMERFTGTVRLTVEDAKSIKVLPCAFVLTIETQDIEQMINLDSDHCATLTGSVSCQLLSKEDLEVQAGGQVQMFKESTNVHDAKEVVYEMELISSEGKHFHVKGVKIMRKEDYSEVGIRDSKLLSVEIFEITSEQKYKLADGSLKNTFADIKQFVESIEILNVESELEQLRWRSKFGKFFADTLWEIYGGLSSGTLYDPLAPPRKQRELRIGSIVPEVMYVTTEDQVDVKLTRYNGGGKGPLLISVGMATTTRLFSLDTVDENFVEFFMRHGYDLWLFDWRGSIDLPASCYGQYSIDHVGYYDYPAAVDKVLKVTGEKDIQILAHCVGSLSLFASLLGGRLKGKVRSVIASQVSATPVGSTYNKFKAKIRLPGFLKDVVLVEAVTGYTDVNANFSDKLFTKLSTFVTNVITTSEEKCSSQVCHRLTAIYGLFWEHENLNVKTHDTLHETFGSGSISLFAHLTRLMRAEKLVTSKGTEFYLPGMEKQNRLSDPDYLESINELNIPICFLHGEKNHVFDVEGHKKTMNLAREAHPDQYYELLRIRGYGHLDSWMGKNSSRDVFPYLLRFLDKYAEDNVVEDKDAVSKVKSACDKIKLITQGKVAERNKMKTNMLNNEHTSSPLPAENRSPTPTELRNVPYETLSNILKRMDLIHPNEKVQVWKRKENVKCCFNREPEYNPPTPHTSSATVVKEVFIEDAAEKREIYVMSDLHLGSPWSYAIEPRLKDFIQTLAQMAYYNCHTLVLLGDILDLWQVPITSKQLSNDEYVAKWKENETIMYFAKAIKAIADKDVEVFYVTGNHDHDIREEDVHALFGNKVHYIQGILVYVINNGTTKYRIRFEHGHEYDLYNSYSIIPEDIPWKRYPIGYFVTRCVASAEERYLKDTEMILEDVTRGLFLHISPSLLGSALIDILSKTGLANRVVESLFERALDQEVMDKHRVAMELDYSYVNLKDIIESNYMNEVSKKIGSSRVFSMLKASVGDWNDFLREFDEDVVVFGHSHKWRNKVLSGKHGHLYYLNAGTFIDFSNSFSYCKLVPPTATKDGHLEVAYKENDLPDALRDIGRDTPVSLFTDSK